MTGGNNTGKPIYMSDIYRTEKIVTDKQEIEQLKAKLKITTKLKDKAVVIMDDKLKEIEQLKEENKIYTSILEGTEFGKTAKENTKLKEEIRILKQYAEIARNDKHQRKIRLNEALEEIKELKNK